MPLRLDREFVGTLLFFGTLATLPAEDIAVESRRLHLGRPGSWEWTEFKDRPVDGERLEVRFQASAHAGEQVLRIWQSNVKLSWPVLVNGRKIGKLTTAETPMESVYALPAGVLQSGDNTLIVEAPGGLDDIEVGPVHISPQPMADYLSEAKVEVQVTDEANGKAMPCRLTLTRKDGTLQPLHAGPASDVATRVGVVYARNGKAVISAPAGEYVLQAGHGFEWGVVRQDLSLKLGENPAVAMKLKREVATQGWIAADSHIHTLTHSGHGDATIEERMITIAGEGIELAIATDHNHHTDYAPVAEKTRTASWFTSAVGNEVTTKHGHFNAFPIQAGAPVVKPDGEDWSKLLPAIRATPGVKVITLNHPRDLHSGFVPLGGLQFNPNTGRHRDAEALAHIDALEVITSGAMQSDIHLLFRDWFALLNRGHRMSAIASSDSHDVTRFILGQGRTYVAAEDTNPAGVNLDEVWRSYQQGRLLVSLGLLANMTVEERFKVGDLATGLGSTFKVEVVVSGPSWVRADQIKLFANGIPIREQALTDEHKAGVKARLVWKLPRPAHDVHLVAIATGPGVKEPFWEIPRPYQPASKDFVPRVIGATNPIWIDADGDQQFHSAFAIAQNLVQRFGQDRGELKAILKDYDQAVAAQVDSLQP